MQKELIKDFYYAYSHPIDLGDCDEKDKIGILNYENSALSLEPDNTKLIGWKMSPERLHIIFDFGYNRFIEKLKVKMFPLSAENRNYWENGEFEVLCRAEEDNIRYRMIEKIIPKYTNEKLVEINSRCRFVQIIIKRSPWRQFPIPQILFWGEKNTNINVNPIEQDQINEEFKKESVQVDKYGQAIYANWENKITNDSQLINNRENEKILLKDVKLDSNVYDKYGGIKNYFNVGALGYFRVEKYDGVWWFITPEGNPFIMKGVDLVDISEISYQSPLYVKNTETIRTIYEELPDKDELACAYETTIYGYPALNFTRANLKRKYGDDYESKWVDVTMKRLVDWGFNASSKWKKHPDVIVPYICNIEDSGKKIGWLPDPYSPTFKEDLDKTIRETVMPVKDDPYLIGYHYSNESGLDKELMGMMLSMDGSCDMKVAFINYLADRVSIEEINKLFSTEAKSLEELIDTKLSINNIPNLIINDFITTTAKIYYRTIRDLIKKYDKQHMFLGTALTPEWRSTYAWNIGGLEFIDVLSFDYYILPEDDWLEQYVGFDKPIINIEFSFTGPERGHSPIFSHLSCKNQKHRGEQYKKLVQKAFAYPQFIGSGFFILSDQPISGRCNPDGSYGECHNFGLVDITDEPYYDFIEGVKEAHDKLENIHAQKKII